MEGAQRFAYGLTLRQSCPRGHCALEPLQRHLPLVLAGDCEQVLVAATDSQVKPEAQAELQPPQLASLVEMLTQVPSQQRLAALAPHDTPLLRLGCVQVPEALQTSLVQAFPSSAHEAPLWIVWVQVAVPLQVRVMHALLLQVTAVPEQMPRAQTSP